MERVLLTGAAGDIGSAPAQAPEAGLPGAAAERHQEAGRSRGPTSRSSPPISPASTRSRRPSTASRASSTSAAISVEGPWETILQSNIIGCYNLFEAARRKGVKRVVFASSNHAVGFYPRHHHIGIDVTVRPDSRYGVSKAFGEALGSLYADKHGLRVLCLRIGNVGDKPLDKRRLSIWVNAGGPGPADPHRPRAPRPALRDLLRRLLTTSAPGGTTAGLRLRLPPDRPRRGLPRAGAGRAGQAAAGPGRRLLPGRHLLQRRSSTATRGGCGRREPRGDMSNRPRILLTHTPEMRQNYYGARALAGLHALGEVVLHEGSEPLDTPALDRRGASAARSSSPTGRRACEAALFAALPDLVAVCRVAVDIRNIDVAGRQHARRARHAGEPQLGAGGERAGDRADDRRRPRHLPRRHRLQGRTGAASRHGAASSPAPQPASSATAPSAAASPSWRWRSA